jgi:endonuclease/exonuclease/phosphatase family metal-dependent hydrolase
MLVRSWNIFHGNAYPPGRRDFLEEMIRLATNDRPDVVCLQEVPVWARSRLEAWSNMTAVVDVAARPLLPARLAKTVTDLHHGLLRSAFTGQANAILLARGLRVVDHRVREIHRHERRICQAVRLDGGVVVGNLHASGERHHGGQEELDRAVALVDGLHGRITILAGDFNMQPVLDGFTPIGPAIDHIVVRGADAGAFSVWPIERRTIEGRVLSDHAPVEVDVDVR